MIVVVLALFLATGKLLAAGSISPDPGVIVAGHARFTVITPTLLRLEFSNNGKFINSRSYFAWQRHVQPPKYQIDRHADRLVIRTSRLKLIWHGGSAGFTPKNLSIRFSNDTKHWSIWRPGDKQTGNLGGTRPSLDGCTGRMPISNGVLSRNGWYLLRDRSLLVTSRPNRWIKPRPTEEKADWYFFGYGKKQYRTALHDLTTISGREPIPPKYLLGSLRSRYHSFSSKQFRQLVLEYNAHAIPLDVIDMDMGWHTAPHWGSYDWNRQLIPHPERLLAWLHEQGLHVTVNWHPQSGVGIWDTHYKQFARAVGLNPNTKMRIPFEPSNQKSMRNVFKLLLDPLRKQGIDFWWLDWGWRDSYQGWVNALDFWNIQNSGTARRGASLSRWGGWGDQRYPVFFSGDTSSRWRVLRFEIPFTVTAGNVAADYWSNDIGGFGLGYLPSAELYTRWIDFGSLSPVFRTHNTGATGDHRVPWYYGNRTFSATSVAYQLRSRLFPYIYTCAYQCWKHSVPLLRPLYLSHPSAPAAYQHPHEYSFGSSLLVAPIVSRGIGNAWLAATEMWFPRGTWWNLLTSESVNHSGDRPVLASASEIPVFARGGIPLPMQRFTLRMSSKPTNPLVVCVYPGSHGHSILYEDDGLSSAYLHGAYALTALHYDNLGTKGIRVTVGPTTGNYAGQPLKRKVIIRLPVTTVPLQVRANGHAVPQSTNAIPGYSYNPAKVTTEIRLPARSIRRQTIIDIRFSGSSAAQALLPKVINRIAMVHRALAGAGEMATAWKFTLDRILFQLQTLRSVAAQVFGPASATTISASLARSDATLTQVQANLLRHHNAQARAAQFALSNIFLRAATKLRDAGTGLLAHNQHRYYAEYSVYRRGGTRTYSGLTSIVNDQTGLMVHALIPPIAINGKLILDLPGLAHRSFPLLKSGQDNLVFLPIAPATKYPLFNFHGNAIIRIKTTSAMVSVSRRIRLCHEMLDQWRIVGPFRLQDSPKLNDAAVTTAILQKAFIGLNAKSVTWISRTWQSIQNRSWYNRKRWFNVSNLYQVSGPNTATAWAVTWVKVAAPMACQFRVRCDGGIRIWLNGHYAAKAPQTSNMDAAAYQVHASLKPGWNQILVQSINGSEGWGFSLRLCMPRGTLVTQSNHPPHTT